MAGILSSVNDSAAYGSIFNPHYFEGPIENPNWSQSKDPWKVKGKDNAKVTFTDEWTEWETGSGATI